MPIVAETLPNNNASVALFTKAFRLHLSLCALSALGFAGARLGFETLGRAL
ncbi:MAG TPA: hypothetical protein V6D18_19980 [Thermosynechococcaceae cyanobacterium]